MKSCINHTCVASLRGQNDDVEACVACGGALFVLPAGSNLPAYEAAPTAALAPEAETVVTVTPAPAPATEESLPAGERGVSEEESAALLAAARAVDDETDTHAVPVAPEEPVIETVPSVEALGIVPPAAAPAPMVVPVVVQTPAQPTTAPAAPTPVTQVIRFRSTAPVADPTPSPRLAPTPTVDNDAFVARLEDERRQREQADDIRRAAARAQRQPTPRPANDDIEPTTETEDFNLEPTRSRSWLWLVAAAVVLMGVLGWWLLRKPDSTDNGANRSIAADTTPAPATQVVDEYARSKAIQANIGVGIANEAIKGVASRVTTLENGRDGQHGVQYVINTGSACTYPNLGACVVDQTRRQGVSMQAAGLVQADRIRQIVTDTCVEMGCVE